MPSAPSVEGACDPQGSILIGGAPADIEVIELDTDGSGRTVGYIGFNRLRIGGGHCVMPMAPAAVIAMTWEIIVFCTFYLFARAIQGTFEFAPLVGA